MISSDGADKLDHRFEAESIIPSDEFIPACANLNNPAHLNREYALEFFKVGASIQRLFKTGSSEDSMTERSPPIINKRRLRGSKKPRLQVYTVASDGKKAHRLKRSAEHYGAEVIVLGEGEEWKGGNMHEGPGGGQKINLLGRGLLTALGNGQISDATTIIFVDGYDVMFTGNPLDILARWKQMNYPLLFAAERFCYPNDGVETKNRYADLDAHANTNSNTSASRPTPYKYLNSGGFIGRAWQVRAMLDSIELEDDEDDQRAYTTNYLEGRHIQALDTQCQIFQCLNGSVQDLTIDTGRGCVYNKITQTWPAIIHANGPTKKWFDTDGKAIGGRIRDFYGQLYTT